MSDTSTRTSAAAGSWTSRSAKSRPGTLPWNTALALGSATMSAAASDADVP
ncbi:hypothetical protein [Streptomyces europaeiscabiei]|uniref:hypothetical protein n=1 Tax=Streptomyces europaeiscabiei TaxID=146819 RepID=UPI003990590F